MIFTLDDFVKCLEDVLLKDSFDDEITLQTELTDFLLDSLSLVGLVLKIEDEYLIDLSDFDSELICRKTVGDFVDAVNSIT